MDAVFHVVNTYASTQIDAARISSWSSTGAIPMVQRLTSWRLLVAGPGVYEPFSLHMSPFFIYFDSIITFIPSLSTYHYPILSFFLWDTR